MNTKSFIYSKTFWLNLGAFLIAAATYIDGHLLSALGIPENQQMDVMKIVGFVIALVNIALRFCTKSQVKLSKVKDIMPVFLMLMLITSASSCSFISSVQRHSSVAITNTPSSPNDTISIVGKFWGAADLIQQYAPANNKVGRFLRESTKHCNVEIIQYPLHGNDTIAVQLTCDSMYNTVKQWLPKNQK
jgi:hypothetical protein